MKDLKLVKAQNDKFVTQISDFINDKIVAFDYDGAVVGISGGVDSALTAMLASIAFDRRYNFGKVERYN